jgi:hypothetical protein
MPRSVFVLVAAAALSTVLTSSAVSAGQTAPNQAPRPEASRDQKTPQQHLDEAKRILAAVDEASLSAEASPKFVALKRDLNDLAKRYLERAGRAGSADTPPQADRGRAGTSGTTGTSIPGTVNATRSDWRPAYSTVEADLRGLVGSGSNSPVGTETATTAPVTGGVANLNATVRGQLQQVRTHLQMFYAATMGERERKK